jgi:hypothetical protein
MAEKVKQYKVYARSKEDAQNGYIKGYVNGEAFSVKENEPTELRADVYSYLVNARNVVYLETGQDSAIDTSEQSFQKEVSKKFEVIEL